MSYHILVASLTLDGSVLSQSNAEVSGGARGLNSGLDLYLPTNFVYASRVGSVESVLVDIAISTNISRELAHLCENCQVFGSNDLKNHTSGEYKN